MSIYVDTVTIYDDEWSLEVNGQNDSFSISAWEGNIYSAQRNFFSGSYIGLDSIDRSRSFGGKGYKFKHIDWPNSCSNSGGYAICGRSGKLCSKH